MLGTVDHTIRQLITKQIGVLALCVAEVVTMIGCNSSQNEKRIGALQNGVEAKPSLGISEIKDNRSVVCDVNGEKGPPSFRVSDIGGNGVPKLLPKEVNIARHIEHYLKSPTLRFSHVGGEFVVFDATDGPCYGGIPGYAVLNGSCNEIYEVVAKFSSTGAFIGCYGTPYPWRPKAVNRSN